MNLFLKFIENVKHIGVRENMDEYTIRRINFINLFYLIVTPTYFASAIQTYYAEGGEMALRILAFLVLFQFVLLFNHLGKFRLSEVYVILITNSTIFYFDIYNGIASGSYLFYFPMMLMIAFLADYRHQLTVLLDIILTFLFVVGSFLLRDQLWYNPNVSVESNAASFLFNSIFSTLLVGYCTFVIIRSNYQSYQLFKSRIEERRVSEEQARAALREKETLLAEVHHRVKNNLAVINSLLNLQMNLVENEDARAALRESKNRVSSMALIHRKLYRNDNFEEINMGEYIEVLVAEIRQSYPEIEQENIHVTVDAEKLKLELTDAIPCGLILNELLSNCFKYAFEGRSEGNIRISFTQSQTNQFVLTVADNGVGLPEGYVEKSQNSLGMTLIESLCGQLDGQFEYISPQHGGTTFQLKFNSTSPSTTSTFS